MKMTSMTDTIAAAPPASDEGELRNGAVGFLGLLSQSVAGIGPSTGVAVILGLVVATSGNGAWLVWLISTLVLVSVAICISQFTKRYASSGGLYVLNAQAGRGFGLVTAWAAILFSLASAPILPLAFGLFLSDYLNQIGASIGPAALWIVTIMCTIVATGLTLRDVALSAIAMFVIEILSMAAMLVLLVIVAVNHSSALIDPMQLGLQGVTAHQIAQGVAFSLLAFAAFESSLFLGKEAKNPLTQMSRAITWSVVICGILFTVFTYVLSIGFRGITPGFAENPNPLRAIAEANHVGFLNNFVQPGVIIALFGVTIANLNFASRLLMTLSKERMLPAMFAHVSARHRTPTRAILFVAGLDIVVLTLLSLTGNADFAAYGFLGGLSGYWVGMTYIVASAAMMYYLFKRKELTARYMAIGVFSIAAFLYFFWTSSVPLPASPGDVILLIFYVTVALSVLHWIFLKLRKSPVLDMLGTSATKGPG